MRELFPPEKEHKSYHYDEEEALILHERDWQIPEALVLLARKCHQASHTTGFITELAHRNISEALLSLGEDSLEGSLVLHLSAPLPVRLERNAKRKSMRIPEHIVVSIPQELTSDEIAAISSRVGHLELLETSEDEAKVQFYVQQILQTFFIEDKMYIR